MRDDREYARKLDALVKLGVRRQSPPDKSTLDIYTQDLEKVPSDIVEIACLKIGRREKREFEPAFPRIDSILSECHALQRRIADRTNTTRLLTAPDIQPISRERYEEFLSQVRQAIGRSAFPGAKR